MTLSILFLCFSGRQGSILIITRRWQCRSILQRFIEHTGKLNFHLFSGSLLGYLDLPPSPSSLVEGNTESLFSRSRPLKFAINSNNMGWWCITCFSCIGWKPAASHTLLVVLAPFGVGKRDGFSPLQVQIFTQQIYPWARDQGSSPCSSSSASFISFTPITEILKAFRFGFFSHIAKPGAE